jgi:Bacterial alpha-L-rhamnosidase 6 hairpin glycosidase domain
MAQTTEKNTGPQWIWMPRRRKDVDCHLLFRREFRLTAKPTEAALRITASDQYRLYVNGRLVGDGPARGEIPTAYVDEYPLADLPLKAGTNCIAVLAHNTMMPQHGQSLVPGGLWVNFTCRAGSGRAVHVASDASWRVAPAAWFTKPAPRRFFAVGFNEKVNFADELRTWTRAGFDDLAWASAVVVNDRPYRQLIDRPIPLFRFESWHPATIRRHGTTGPLDGVWGLAFEQCGKRPRGNEAVFGTYVYSDRARTIDVGFGCDNWARVRLNGRVVWQQGRPDAGFVNHLEYDRDKYDGMVHGNGHRHEPGSSRNASEPRSRAVRLKRGWNRLTVWLWRPATAYGFEGAFLNPRTGEPFPVRCSATRDTGDANTWMMLAAEDSTIETGRPVATTVDDVRPYLEPSHLADWDRQTETARPPRGAASFLAKARGKGPMILQSGEFIEFALPADGVGFIDLELRGPAGTLVDVTIGEAQTALDHGRIRSLYNGLWQTDRLVLDGRWNHWLSFDRRAGRYLAVCVRDGSGPVEVRRFALRSQHYPVARPGRFACSDPTLTRMWDVGARTVDAATFDVSEDCPTREKAQWGGDTYLRMFEIAYLWGDVQLSAKAAREFAADQKADRWSRPMVPSGYGDKLVEYCFLLAPWIWYQYLFDGDLALVRDTFAGVENLLSYADGLADRRGFARQGDPKRNHIYIDYSMQPYPRCGDTIGMMQAAYVMALESGADLADLLGKDDLAGAWRGRAEHVRLQTRRHFWVDRRGLYADGIRGGKPGGTFSAVTNYWMMLAGISTPEQDDRILARLWHDDGSENMDFWNRGESPYSKFFMSEALLERGLWQKTFAMWRGYYGSMLRHPEALSAFEMWRRDIPHDRPMPGNSLVHPFAIGPMAHLASYVAGIKPLGPGFDGLLWQPMPGDLDWMDAEFPLVGRDDTVKVTMKRDTTGGRRLVLQRPSDLEVMSLDTFLAPGDSMVVSGPSRA